MLGRQLVAHYVSLYVYFDEGCSKWAVGDMQKEYPFIGFCSCKSGDVLYEKVINL